MHLNRKIPPQPKEHLFFGNALQYCRGPLEFLTGAVREHGDVVRLRLPGMSVYVLANPAHIEYVLRANHRNFIKDKITRSFGSFLGQGLLTSEGDFWRRQRRLAQPALLSSQVERYAGIMTAATERLMSAWQPGQCRDLSADMTRLALQIVAQSLLGADMADEAAAVGQSLADVMAYFATPAINWSMVPAWLPTPAGIRYRRAIRRLDDTLFGAIRREREAGGQREDLLSRLLAARDDDGRQMTERELRDELMTLFLAGHETTALSLAYTFHLLAEHPEVESRLTKELADVLQGRTPTVADLPRLTYLQWVVQESMRLYPPAWAVGREAVEDCQIGGYHVPRGTQIWLPQWVVHRDPRWYAEPEAFRPERWDGDFAKTLPRCAYFPFGDGPRVCIGNHFAMMEAVLVSATVLGRYRLETIAGQPLELVPSITLRPKHPLRMVIRKQELTFPQASPSSVQAAT